jgi:RNA polymerase sigma-70 factor, ECF subfamily
LSGAADFAKPSSQANVSQPDEAGADVPTDTDYIQMVRRGDPAGAEALFRRHAAAILRFAARMTGSRHEAEEVCQDAFVKMIDRAEQYDGRAPFGSWLLSIAANTCRDHLRRRRRGATVPLDAADMLASPDPLAVNTLVDQETRDAVKRALSALSADQREALVLARYHGLPYDQIAATLGISEGAVKTRIFRAMETLKTLFARDRDGGAPGGDVQVRPKEDQAWIAAKP